MSYEGMRGQGAAQKAETNMCFCGLCAEGGRESKTTRTIAYQKTRQQALGRIIIEILLF
jgi:hypothetical protein